MKAKSKPDYERMWRKLEDEISLCHSENVQQIPPFIFMAYMRFIERLVRHNKDESVENWRFLPHY